MESIFEEEVFQRKAREEAENFERLATEVACADRSKLLAVLHGGPITAGLYRSLLDQMHQVNLANQISLDHQLRYHTWEIAVAIIEKVLSRGFSSQGSLTLLIGTALLIAFKVGFANLDRRRRPSKYDLLRLSFCNWADACSLHRGRRTENGEINNDYPRLEGTNYHSVRSFYVFPSEVLERTTQQRC